MNRKNLIFPVPQKMTLNGKMRDMSAEQWIILPEEASFRLKKRILEMALTASGSFLTPPRVAGGRPQNGKLLAIMSRKTGIAPEGYHLTLKEQGPITLEAADDAGFFYGMQSICQLLKTPEAVPCCRIQDQPSMRERGYMLDISRNKVPTMETLKDMVRSLAVLRYNSLQLYMEHTYAFSAHERVWASYSPVTSEEIMELDAFCHEHFIELVPNINSFGHLNQWLKHQEYRDLAECDPPYILPGAGIPMQGVLTPGKKSLDFMDSLYREFLPNFTSRKLNIGCDETVELGKGKSAALCRKKGVTQVYVAFLSELTKKASSYGFEVEFWGDIILKQPEYIAKLPKGITALAWGYEYNHPFKEQCEQFRKAGVEYLVCPGTSTWQTILGRTTNMIECIRNAMYYGSQNGARGLLMTDWGDNGHHQYYPVSWPGMAMGGGAAWNAASKETESLLPYAVSLAFAPGEDGVRLGRFLLECGRVYDDFTTRVGNSTAFGRILPSYPVTKKSCGCFLTRMKTSEVRKARTHMEALLKELTSAPFRNHALVNAELENALRMALCALTFLKRCLGGKWDAPSWRDSLRHVIDRHEKLWLERNRIGGLYESSSYLRKALDFDPDEWKKR